VETTPAGTNPAEGDSGDAETGQTGEATVDGAGEAAAGQETSGEAEAEAATDSQEGLPEWEPLTPELVEDEAIRGDFMLRWAVILLAFLFGCRELNSTETLVHIRTGEYLLSHGVLPPATDVFSYTAADRPWVNLAWAFDLLLAGVHGAGGAAGISLVTGLVSAVTFYLLLGIRREGLPTWWNSVCAAIALLAVHVQATALPELVTLLGTVWVLKKLVEWSQTGERKVLWCVVVSLAVWSNLDERAYAGWLLLAAFTAGTAVARACGSRGGLADAATLSDAGKATAAGLVALMVNPSGWHAVLSPLAYYRLEVPARMYYAGRVLSVDELQWRPLFSNVVWTRLDLHVLAAVLLLVIAVVTVLMHARRLNAGLLVVLLAGAVPALFVVHELPAAALVACAVAALTAQDWYKAHCRTEYSVATLEVLWSRLGRALTVLALVAVAWLGISGRLMGRDGRRIGLGWSSALAGLTTGIEEDLKDVPKDARIFPFRLEHGDLLIWSGRPTFADSRVRIFADGDGSLLDQHNQARFALRQRRADNAAPAVANTPAAWQGQRDLWLETFQRFEVSLVAPRMWGRTPDYESCFDLMKSTDWTLNGLGSTTAVFGRQDSGQPEVDAWVKANPFDIVQTAVRDCRGSEAVLARVDWPRPPSRYQQFLTLPMPAPSNATRRAQHELTYLTAGVNGGAPLTAGQAMSLATLVTRDGLAGAAESPTDPQPFRILANAYAVLDSLESSSQSALGLPRPGLQRLYQRIHAMRQALILDPDSYELLAALTDIYAELNHWDLALDSINRCLDILRVLPELNEELLGLARRLNQMRDQLKPQLDNVRSRVDEFLAEENPDRLGLARSLHQQGYILEALKVLEADRLMVAQNRDAEVELSLLLAQAGRLEEASEKFDRLDGLDAGSALPISWLLHSSWLSMAKGDHTLVIGRCQRRLGEINLQAAQAMLAVAPFAMPRPEVLSSRDIWPVSQTLVGTRVLYGIQEEAGLLRWTLATACLESGRCGEAAGHLEDLLEADPDSILRPVTIAWLELLRNKTIPLIPAQHDVPILFEGGPEDPEAPIEADAATEGTEQ